MQYLSIAAFLENTFKFQAVKTEVLNSSTGKGEKRMI